MKSWHSHEQPWNSWVIIIACEQGTSRLRVSWNPEAYTLYEYRTRTIAFNQRRRIFQLKSHGSCTTRSLKFKASNFKFCFLSNTMYQETSVSKDLDLSNFKQNIKTTRMSNDGISAKRIADMKGQGRFKRNGGSATEPGCDHHSPEPQYKHKGENEIWALGLGQCSADASAESGKQARHWLENRKVVIMWV